MWRRWPLLASRRWHGVDALRRVHTAHAPPWNVLFFGSDDFSLPHLQTLHEAFRHSKNGDGLIRNLDVVTGEKNEVDNYSRDHGLQTHRWPLPDNLRYDLGVLASFGHLIPKRVIGQFPLGIINVHPSLLPRWRGAAPLIHTILSGDTHSGVCVMQITPHRFDTGPLLAQTQVSVPPDIMCKDLTQLMAGHGSRLLLEVMQDLAEGKVTRMEQQSNAVTYARKATVDNANINWGENTVAQIDRQYRALDQLYNLRSSWNGLPVRLLNMVPQSEMNDVLDEVARWIHTLGNDVRPGRPLVLRKYNILCIKCKDGWVAFRDIIIKKMQTPKAFSSGYLQNVGGHKAPRASPPQVFASLPNGLEQLDYYKSS